MLADLYGPQRLLASGAIPHQLVFSDPSFLRPCQHLQPAGGYIQFFASRPRARAGRALARDRHAHRDAGRHRLRARQPHGAHQRRRRHLRRLQRACGWRRSSSSCRPRWPRRANRADPTIALLTPGPRHNDFFSHAYLARYLGLLLVEGGDLRVTGDRVSLKTLDGLMPIDLIVRCVAGARRRSAGARLLGLRRPGGPAAGRARAARPRGQRAGLGAGREPRLERLPAEARQGGCWARSC